MGYSLPTSQLPPNANWVAVQNGEWEGAPMRLPIRYRGCGGLGGATLTTSHSREDN